MSPAETPKNKKKQRRCRNKEKKTPQHSTGDIRYRMFERRMCVF